MALLDNKRLVIVGGTGGLGLSAARAFVREGARLVVCGLSAVDVVAEAQRQLGAAGFAFAGDATDPAIADRAVAECAERWGGLDGLFHVAGGSGRRWGDGPVHELTDEGWQRTLDLNLTSLAWSNRAAIRHWLKTNTGGAILNMGSVLGFAPSPRYFTTHAYAAAKAGIVGLSRSLAACYASRDIRVNVLAPGLIDTPMAERAATNPQILAFLKTKQTLDGGRLGRPTDVDGAAVFLMSDAARFITGQVLCVDGGWTVSEGQYGDAPAT
jgi:NAD(P)-dependent dehydrogenase (short-subunit alcohol dehydrogenase family)